MRFNPEDYETVEARLEKFWAEHPEGRVLTSLLSDPGNLDECVVRAEIYFDADDDRPRGTGLAFEKRGGAGANQTSHLENAETSSIGRALANCGYKAKKDAPRPSREEMRKAQLPPQAPRSTPAPAPESPGDRQAAKPGPNGENAEWLRLRDRFRDLWKALGKATDESTQQAYFQQVLGRRVFRFAELTADDLGQIVRALEHEASQSRVQQAVSGTEQPLPLTGGESAPPDDGEALKHWRH